MMCYKCKRDIWGPSLIENFPDELLFKKGNLYLIEKNQTTDEEGRTHSFESIENEWFHHHFAPM